jgi:hypothetical protein
MRLTQAGVFRLGEPRLAQIQLTVISTSSPASPQESAIPAIRLPAREVIVQVTTLVIAKCPHLVRAPGQKAHKAS